MEKSVKFIYKLTLSYKGTHYQGWQYQTKDPETVQNYVQKVVAKIARYEDYQVIGASRTDGGVHSSGQTLKVILPKEVSPENLMRGMNSKLPSDIKVTSCENVHETFNVNQDSKFKEYHYYFTLAGINNAIMSEVIYPLSLNSQSLDLELMQKACKKIIGEHDFRSLCVPGPSLVSASRNILKCSIEKTSFLTLSEEVYYLKIQGTGFLKYMVRFIMGALWDIGLNQLSIEDFALSLKTGEKHGIRNKAPSKGLHLIHIEY